MPTSAGTISLNSVNGLVSRLAELEAGGGGVDPHTHPQSEITGLVADLAGKAPTSHTHAQSDITSLVADLAAKAAASHTHAQSDITSLVADLAAKAAAVHTHAIADITSLQATLDAIAAPPTGAISDFAGTSAPTGWLLCDGAAVSRTTYADLFALIDEDYGAGNGTTTFNVPNLKGKVAVGFDSADGDFDALGETGGAKTVTLSAAQSGTTAHTHGLTGSTASGGTHTHEPVSGDAFVARDTGSGTLAATAAGTAWRIAGNTDNADSPHTHGVGTLAVGTHAGAAAGSSHTNLQPYITVQKIIKT